MQESFQSPNFIVDEFIAECRRRVPLESVLNDVRGYGAALEHELVELINKDYTDFVNLSTNLTGIDKIVSDLRTAALALRKDLTVVRGAVDSSILEMEGRLEEKRAVTRKKETLQLFVNTAKTLAKIEKLLHIGDAEEKLVLRADEETSNLIERVASDFNQVRFYASKGTGLPFFEQIVSKRMLTIETILGDALVAIFKQALTERNTDMISNCLRTYAAIEKVAEAEEIFRVHIVRPVKFTVRNVKC